MDWSVIIAVCAVWITAVMAWKMWRLKKNVYDFADVLEWNLDAVIAGREPEETGETEDSLLGRVNEKLHRVNHILEQKEQETARNREQMKELISDISHQTKTPIANQKIYLEILKGRLLPGDAEEFVRKLEHQTDKLDFLFQSMVKMSRLETIGKAVSGIVPAAEKKEIRLSLETKEGAAAECLLPHDRKWTEEAVQVPFVVPVWPAAGMAVFIAAVCAESR